MYKLKLLRLCVAVLDDHVVLERVPGVGVGEGEGPGVLNQKKPKRRGPGYNLRSGYVFTMAPYPR